MERLMRHPEKSHIKVPSTDPNPNLNPSPSPSPNPIPNPNCALLPDPPSLSLLVLSFLPTFESLFSLLPSLPSFIPQVKFQDIDPHGEVLVKFTVNIYWAMQFQVMREEEVQRTAMRRGREGRAGGKGDELAWRGG